MHKLIVSKRILGQDTADERSEAMPMQASRYNADSLASLPHVTLLCHAIPYQMAPADSLHDTVQHFGRSPCLARA